MIVSFNPVFNGDKNLICAGRDPGVDELAAMRAAAAVILPQGCPRKLYEMARKNCSRVFPNYDARFQYPGKIGQIRLFRETGVRHPRSEIFSGLSELQRRFPDNGKGLPFEFPFVFKFDWGGEGETVFLIRSRTDFNAVRQRARLYEQTGQKGFILQQYIAAGRRCLRAVVIGGRCFTYWRIQSDPGIFQVNVARGARVDRQSAPRLQRAALQALKGFREKTGIDLAGFDFLFPADPQRSEPNFLEINYFFGRTGLGGTQAFYGILTHEIRRWLEARGLRVAKPA